MAALWASRYGINCRIIDKQAKGIVKGQADGIQARSLEIFESFGIVERIERECNMRVEMCFWVCIFELSISSPFQKFALNVRDERMTRS